MCHFVKVGFNLIFCYKYPMLGTTYNIPTLYIAAAGFFGFYSL